MEMIIMNNVIKININKKEDYVSKFNDNILSNDFSAYILEECKSYPLNSDISIEVSSSYKMNDLEKDNLVDMIRANFGNEISEMLFRRKRNIIGDFFMLILGVISLICYLFSSDIPVLSEFILVFSWVLIWESAHNLIFTGFSNKIDIERRKKLTNCKIIFK